MTIWGHSLVPGGDSPLFYFQSFTESVALNVMQISGGRGSIFGRFERNDRRVVGPEEHGASPLEIMQTRGEILCNGIGAVCWRRSYVSLARLLRSENLGACALAKQLLESCNEPSTTRSMRALPGCGI